MSNITNKNEDILPYFQAKAMARFIRNIYAKQAIYQKVDIFEDKWNDFEDLVYNFLKEDYKKGVNIHLTSSFLGGNKWDKLEEIFEYLSFDKAVEIKNIGFMLSESYVGEIFGFSSGLGKKMRIGEFTISESGNIGLVQSFYKDKFDVLTSISNVVYMVSNQAKRKKSNKTQVEETSREERQKQLEKVFEKKDDEKLF